MIVKLWRIALTPLMQFGLFSAVFILAAGLAHAEVTVTTELPAEVNAQLELAGENRAELERAIAEVPAAQASSLYFLISNMQSRDLQSLSADMLLDNVRLAHQARKESKWQISDELFLNDVLPYANVDETRENWRPEMHARAAKIVEGCTTPGEAAQRLNQKLFKEIKVKYSTKRKKANQSPSESIEQGLASCTGLSILLVDACRSVNVPARLVGVPSWTTKRGNHTWVEIWDDGAWHFTGAAEYNADGLNRGWFVRDASKANKESRRHSIYALSFKKTDTLFPITWSRNSPKSYAVNVTDRYTQDSSQDASDEIQLMVLVKNKASQERVVVSVKVQAVDDAKVLHEGLSRGETADTNDILTFKLRRQSKYRLVIPGVADDLVVETKDAAQQTVNVEVALDVPAGANEAEPTEKEMPNRSKDE